MLVTKSVFIRRILDGVPSIIINRGKLDIKALSNVRMSVEELMAELRLKGYAHPEDVFTQYSSRTESYLSSREFPPYLLLQLTRH